MQRSQSKIIKMLQYTSKITRFSFSLILVFLFLFTIYRLSFWLFFNSEINTDLIQAFYLGFKFDLRLAVLLVLPIFLIGWIKYLNLTHKMGKIFWRIYLLFVFTIIIFLYFLDFGHYSYLKTHLNNTIFRFLEDSEIATTMLWQSYPIIWIVISFIALIMVFNFILGKLFEKIAQQSSPNLPLFKKIVINTIVGILILLALYGKFSWYPLRWVDAHFSSKNFIADLTTNPILYSIDTMRYNDSSYDTKKVIKYFPKISNYLKLNNNAPLNFKRPLTLTPKVTGNPNVVLVFLESFSAYKVGIFGNPLNSSPNFDKLVKDSLFFNRFYVAHPGTARSVFTNITGITDINNAKTSTRNPFIVSQNTLINAFEDYQKYYFLGGSANWGNIRGLLNKNINGLKIYEEGSYQSKKQDVWGISDADLFLEAGKVLKQQTKPFLAIIQTSGNHRPYTIPNQNYGFELSKIPTEKIKKYGFESLEELNSFRFMDHSIGVFIKHAKENNYYDNTVFVFFADHGITTNNNGLHRPLIESKLKLGTYHIPLIIHAPKFIKPEVINTIAGHPDMLPIIAGLMNKPYINTAMGRNMLAKKHQNQQYAFTISQGGVPQLGLISKDFYFTMYANGEKVRLFSLKNKKKLKNLYELKDKLENLSKKYPKKTQEMSELAQAIYETSKYLLAHNQKVKP